MPVESRPSDVISSRSLSVWTSVNVVVLNVLPDTDYAKSHIAGSKNLPLGLNSRDFVQAVEKRYGKDKFFITYCAGLICNAGPNAAKALPGQRPSKWY